MKKIMMIILMCALSALSYAAHRDSFMFTFDESAKVFGDAHVDPYSGNAITEPSTLTWENRFYMFLLKENREYDGGANNRTYGRPVKFSNTAPNLIELPADYEVDQIEFIGYCNVEDEIAWISSIATEIDGVFIEVYTDAEGTKKFPYVSWSDWYELSPENMPRMTVSFDTPLKGKIWFRNKGKQPAFYIRLVGHQLGGSDPSVVPPAIIEPTNIHQISYIPEEGQQVLAKDITMTYSNSAGWHYAYDNQPFDYAGYNWDEYAAGENDPEFDEAASLIPAYGTYYKFSPARNGALYLPVVLWEGRPLFVVKEDNENLVPDKVYVTDTENRARTWIPYDLKDEETGESIEAWSVSYENHMNPNIVRFAVSAGKEYYVYARSSKLRLCGFIFTPDEGLVLPENPDPDEPDSIELTLTLPVGTSLNFGAVVHPTDAKVIWSSTDASVLKVDDSGNVTALAEGKANIVASTVNELHSRLCVEVVPSSLPEVVLVESVNITPAVVSQKEGTFVQLAAQLLPENASDKSIMWTSSNEVVASVDHNGLVNILAPGKATIKAMAADGSGVFGLCEITGIKDESELTEIATEMDGKDVYSLEGRLIRLAATRDEILSLPKGIYIIGSLKVIIR